MFTLDNLTKLNQVPLDMTLEGLKAVGQGQQADTIGLQELMREQQFNQQADPFKLQKMQTDVNIGLQDLQQKTRDNRENNYTSYARMQAELQKHLATASSADVTMAYNKFRMMAASQDKRERAMGIAGLQTTEDFLKEQEQTRRSQSVANINASSQKQLEQMRIDAGKYSKKDTFQIGFSNELAKAQGAAKKLAVVQQYIALSDYDPEYADLKPQLKALEARLAPQAKAELAASQPKPGAIDLSGMTQGQVPTIPAQPILPGEAQVPNPAGPFTDAEKERRYQEWLKRQGG